ncbi:MAG: hypothetical protein H6745_00875 [Deltaproteobacteria bacterium]|nr:hypothetical protein [Deltaproteobacteria bacterium]
MATSLELPLFSFPNLSLAEVFDRARARALEKRGRRAPAAREDDAPYEQLFPLPKAKGAPPTFPAAEDLALAGVLSRFSRAERAAIPIVAAGAPLRAGETYLDLLRANRRPFEAMGSLTALSSQRLVPKSAVAKELWLQLL